MAIAWKNNDEFTVTETKEETTQYSADDLRRMIVNLGAEKIRVEELLASAEAAKAPVKEL